MKRTVYVLIVSISALAVILLLNVHFDIPVNELKKKYAGSESKFINIKGMDVHYRDKGEGTPLVLIHGTASSLHTWNRWAEYLEGKFRVIRMDLPAYGLTGPDPAGIYSIERYVVFVASFLDALNVKSSSMAGNSLGGRITWNFALKYPGRLKKIILINSSGYPVEEGIPFVLKIAQIPVLNRALRYITPRFFIKKNIREVYYDDSKISRSLVDRYYHLMLREGNRDAFIIRAISHNWDGYERIKNISLPVLIMWGEEDEWIPVSHAGKFKKDIKGSELIIYKNAGHVPMEEIPDRSARDAEKFLKGSDSG